MTDIKLTDYAHGGGCGCKISPQLLAEILKNMPQAGPLTNLLVGTETSDDAAVYKLNDEQALIATTDFFMPIVDDPYDFGRIAATNAISDVYAMGGTPIRAATPSTRRNRSMASWPLAWCTRTMSSATAARAIATC